MKNSFLIVTATLLVSVFFSCTKERVTAGSVNEVYEFQSVDSTWKLLTLREKIGQTMLMLPDRKKELDLGDGSLDVYFKRYPVTGYFMGWKLFTGVPEEERVDFVRSSVEEYQKASELPLLFQQDYESGVGLQGMTPFPKEMALGAANSPELAYKYGKSVALECRSLGINWVLHPVADLNMNPLNPIVNTRSVSDNPEKAVCLLSEQIKGLQDNSVAATIKHFPGDGVDYRDQHLMTTVNSLSEEMWKQYHGKVFAELIKKGVACIMPGHITLPFYQKEKINGYLPPATLSHELLTGLLKKEMHFNGVVVSDAMTMAGFRGWYKNDLEGQVASFLAGVDILLWPSYEYMDTVEVRIQRGEIPMERLDDAVRRVWAMKERFGLLNKNRELIRPVSAEEKAEIREAAKEITERSITLVRDEDHKLPLSLEKSKSFFSVFSSFSRSRQGDALPQGEEPEDPPGHRLARHRCQGIGIGRHLPLVMLASVLHGLLGGDPVGLKVHDGNARLGLKPTVHHALQEDLLPRRRLGKELLCRGQDGEGILPVEGLRRQHFPA